MHQPYYLRAGEKRFALPWVRLHAVKDYYPFLLLLSRYPLIKATFNFSGVLLEQLESYEKGAKDCYEELSLKNPRYLTDEEANFICRNFFQVNFAQMIKPYPRYYELYDKYIVKKSKKWKWQDLGDLQVYFNLVWFHSLTQEEDTRLKDIIIKGRKFTQEERRYVIQQQRSIVKRVLPLYKKLLRAGQIEISLSPYYHPILPLLCDTNVAAEAGIKLPARRFAFPQDAHWQIAASRKKAESIFGSKIYGSWPSEGSVSAEAINVYEKEGFKWIATDEDILFRSFSQDILDFDLVKSQRQFIYQPYSFRGVNVLFRDKNLSDAISFSYHHWPSQEEAASDFLAYCRNISSLFASSSEEKFILVAMDGENAWEYYEDNGRPFFEKIYREISHTQEINTDTISSFLSRNKARTLKYIASGSWINANFGVWIGSEANNRNWEVLQKMREEWERKRKKISSSLAAKVLRFLYIIEGSDWNWWNTFEDNGQFRNIFLSYIKYISKVLKLRMPYR